MILSVNHVMQKSGIKIQKFNFVTIFNQCNGILYLKFEIGVTEIFCCCEFNFFLNCMTQSKIEK